MTRRASSLSALLAIGALALLWCCAPCSAVGQKNWTPDGPISVSAGAGNELQNGKG
jgi:hypothetical protein